VGSGAADSLSLVVEKAVGARAARVTATLAARSVAAATWAWALVAVAPAMPQVPDGVKGMEVATKQVAMDMLVRRTPVCLSSGTCQLRRHGRQGAPSGLRTSQKMALLITITPILGLRSGIAQQS